MSQLQCIVVPGKHDTAYNWQYMPPLMMQLEFSVVCVM